MQVLEQFYNFVTCGFLEVLLYVVIDVITKSPLGQTSRWWYHLCTKWEEFQQHEESMEMMQELQSKQAAASAATAAVVNSAGPPTGFRSDGKLRHPAEPPEMTPRFGAIRHGGHPMHAPEFRRKPLHSYLQSPIPSWRRGNDVAESTSFTSRVLCALGLNSNENLPLGLPNSGANICFMNVILQCLAHTPGFLECFAQDASRAPNCSAQEQALLGALHDVLQTLRSAEPSRTAAVRTRNFRQAASALFPSIISHPTIVQQQQDAAEFLTVLLQRLHDVLRVNLRQLGNGKPQVAQQDGFQLMPNSKYNSQSLNMLKFIYGDVSPQKIEELKLTCRRELEQISGLEYEACGDPIQRLSDLEWLSYKEQNNSAIDDLLTGQLVEMQFCTACSDICISIQNFNVLNVPIVEPRTSQGLVYLEDCFAKFCTFEELYGPDGLRCHKCNSDQKDLMTPRAPPAFTPRAPSPAAASRPSPFTNGNLRARTPRSVMMSPITSEQQYATNDSGYEDGHLRTSTPIQPGAAPRAATRVTDGQRRSLLRQLPEVFVVQLMRFDIVRGQPYKLQRPVHIPLHQMDLFQLLAENASRRDEAAPTWTNSFCYDLCAMCLHLGAATTTCGHYVNYARLANGSWFRYDDESVTSVNMEYELNTRTVRENAYLLFYRKTYRQRPSPLQGCPGLPF